MSEHNRRTADDDAFTAFVARSWHHHLKVARLLTGDPHRAEELLQDCLAKLYPRWRRLSRQGSPEAYLRRMLVNGNVTWWRRRKRENLVAEPPDRADPLAAPAEPYEELRRALLALAPRQRAVVVLRHYADLRESDVAAAMGCSVGTVKSQNARALARLRALLPAPTDQGATT